MGILAQRSLRRVPDAPRHPEVDQENSTALETDNQILAAAPNAHDPLSLEAPFDLGRLERPDEARVRDAYTLEAATAQHRVELRADGLDLGELRQRRSAYRRRGGAEAPRGASATRGVACFLSTVAKRS